MSSLKQLEANRLNAQKSTGPRTGAGKAAVRLNALKSGIDAEAEIITGEDPAKLESLVADYHHRFDASTAERRALVDTLVHCEWTLRRLRRAEASLWRFATMETTRRINSNEHPEGRVLDVRSREFERLQRRINATQRNYQLALKQLETLPLPDDQPESNE